jgi:hypothetical protein
MDLVPRFDRARSAHAGLITSVLSHTKLQGKFTLRLAIGNIRTTEGHVARTWELLQGTMRRLISGHLSTKTNRSLQGL